ncbi:outer membrane protein in capsule/EPS biosynthesis locus [Shewanella algicola]|uniref:Capsule assembly Wzi family protein n=1 Tax=Shewanella algicola TaxID=640633 RepID=A0A9X1ZA87_9GAMM|nr:capsule assembly Wzi family protein [Shewanella algicola]MCL1104675.1 capsule assembly Wzi family protein [Shewanella algicola]GGP54616.1 outer membrane protein in capsule/EPS biosynthesis locus [Shewanella algicola]
MLKGFYFSKLATSLGLSSVLLCTVTQAAPWVDTSDIYLRADIQALADVGVITSPINTFPLMWSGIGRDLAIAEPSLLSQDLVDAYARVNFYYQSAVNNRGNSRIKVAAATDAARFQHFGSDYREKGQLQGSHEYLGQHIAYKLSASVNYDPSDDKDFRFDDNYVAFIFGNWVTTFGSVAQWWGPGFDSSLHLSTNARPMQSLSVTRHNPQAFETPWLSWLGDWTLTAGVSLAEQDRYASNAALWSFRGSIKPLKQLELGISWTAMFCGEGQECSFDSAIEAITDPQECGANDDCISNTNQMTGFDIRYADEWFGVPIGLYIEQTCENASSATSMADCGQMLGVDSRFSFSKQQYKVFFEYSDTMVNCNTESQYNCFYEHSTYQSGSRYYGRAYGSTYDSDAQTYVLGLIGQFENSHGFTSILRYAQLNKDGANRASVWAPQPLKEDLLMLELSYRMPVFNGMWTLGGSVANSEFEVQDDDTQATMFSTFEYRF